MKRPAMTAKRMTQLIKQGRGQGHGKHYRPWIQVTRSDFSSRGRSHIVNNPRTGRQHDLLSDLEYKVFLFCIWAKDVVDLREQYPLSQGPAHNHLLEHMPETAIRGERWSSGTIDLSKQYGIRHSVYPKSRDPIVMTTDLLLTIKLNIEDVTSLMAISIKYKSEIKNKRGLKRRTEKLFLEKMYWKELGVPWGLVTDEVIFKKPYLNLLWLFESSLLPQKLQSKALMDALLAAVQHMNWEEPLTMVLDKLSALLQISKTETLIMFKHALWRRWIHVDLSETVTLRQPLKFLGTDDRMPLPSWHFLHQVGVAT